MSEAGVVGSVLGGGAVTISMVTSLPQPRWSTISMVTSPSGVGGQMLGAPFAGMLSGAGGWLLCAPPAGWAGHGAGQDATLLE